MIAGRISSVLLIVSFLIGMPSMLSAAAVTDFDSTQPRGAPLNGALNSDGQLLDPVIEGFMSPAYRGLLDLKSHFDWSGMAMGNSMRDPGAFAQLSVSNQDFINYLNSLPGDPSDPTSPIGQVLTSLKLSQDVTTRDAGGRLRPEKLLPVTADLCLRCHAPVGWLEGRSEPPSSEFPFLKGQFWGSAFKEYPGFPGTPRAVNLNKASEAEMDGIQCDLCHRQYDNFKRTSRHDGTRIANGNGGFFVDRTNVFGSGEARPVHDFQETGDFCGTCHDVTNPLLKTKTVVNGQVPDMYHPIERTYTEWYWSAYNGGSANKTCQECHAPMKFLGAQTWMLTGISHLFKGVDAKWHEPPYDYDGIPLGRFAAYRDAAERNLDFMKTAADLAVPRVALVNNGNALRVNVRVTNQTGHKLPTGYPEGRMMWIYLKVEDSSGNVLFEDGLLNEFGRLVRTDHTKVYECIHLATGYEDNKINGYSILDADKNGHVSHREKEFHFVLNNFVEKDNRIPPKGFNKAAYNADGAYIVPRDSKDTDFPDGQNWDVTAYIIPLTAPLSGNVKITATLKYQTFSREYVHFLRTQDKEPTTQFGGRARAVPAGKFELFTTWGNVNAAIWANNGKGRPVEMATVSGNYPVN